MRNLLMFSSTYPPTPTFQTLLHTSAPKMTQINKKERKDLPARGSDEPSKKPPSEQKTIARDRGIRKWSSSLAVLLGGSRRTAQDRPNGSWSHRRLVIETQINKSSPKSSRRRRRRRGCCRTICSALRDPPNKIVHLRTIRAALGHPFEIVG